MALWTPAEILTDLWLDAADSATITLDAGAVSQWADKSGNNRHATQSSSSARPTVSASSLVFDGVDDFLTLGTALGKPSSFTIFVVSKISKALSNTQALLFSTDADGSSDEAWGAIFNHSSVPGSLFWQYGDGTNYRYAAASGAFTLNTASQVCLAHTNGVIAETVYKDGTILTNGTQTGTATSCSGTAREMAIGRAGGYAGFYLGGTISEIIISCTSLSTENCQKIEGYIAHKWGIAASLPADHPYKTAAPTIIVLIPISAVLSQRYLLEGTLCGVCDNSYALLHKIFNLLAQPYSLRLLTALIQYYGDTPAVRRLLAQYYGSAALLRRPCVEPYGEALALRQILDQEWTLPEALRRIMEQRYSIAGDALRALIAENYALSEYALLRQQLDQIYVMGAAGALTQQPAISVTADGVAIDPHHINIEIDEGEYAIRGEIHLARQDQYLCCLHLSTEIIITIDTDVYHLLVESPRRSRPEVGRAEYIVPCVSKTILLDSPYAETITREFAGAMASAIVTELAALANIDVEWQCVDWYLPAATLYANNETPLAVIRKIVAAVGGVLQTTPAGVLLCRPEYPVSVPSWASASPDHYLTDMDNYFSIDSTPVIRDGFNRFAISNQDTAAAGLTLEQVDIDAMTKEIRVYQVPWNDASAINLRTSGGSWVSIVAEGVVAETLTDQVEIVGGEGQTTKPIYAMGSHAYKQAVLGAVTIAEDGHLTTEIKDNTLLEVVYATRYHKFFASDALIEDVQFYPEEVNP